MFDVKKARRIISNHRRSLYVSHPRIMDLSKELAGHWIISLAGRLGEYVRSFVHVGHFHRQLVRHVDQWPDGFFVPAG
jgi:hypothetical protein